ncbi:hypothetical protein [Bacillus tuaregi]|uniref:hypothetical protein n=1 Tax=Bacillus tuaregi TaxID=1816695 RepID=UPI0008F94F66|nr:hypothetical protein [Bacillus tuaregi]
MSLLDIYLQKNGKTRYDVFEKTGISYHLFSSANHKSVSGYSIKLIEAMAKTVEKSEGTVLDELLQLEDENAYFEVFNAEDLLLALKNKEEYILIKGEYKKEMVEIAKSQLTDTETLGIELGSAGILAVMAELILKVVDIFSNKDDDLKKIESQVRKYKFKKVNENEILLYLKQLDY